ncbi:MAG: hypothetical protein HYX25_01810 [Candidatus Solibacter usitatus]|nr:hypothetical protein [Candidatus Solibacter usitatus]
MAGISSGYLILDTTLRAASPLRDTSVNIWGFRGPLGAFISAWGGIAMIVSAPWDDWWHNAYGLDVKVLSPPHVLLIAGILAVEMGALILILGRMNRASGIAREKLNALFLYVGAMILVCLMILVLEYIFRIYMHSGFFYRVVAMTVPGLLAGMARASGRRWAATTVTGIYSLFILGCLWILPLFPAEPKLGPVYQQVTHFIPPEFPLLLIVPALALDMLWARTGNWSAWTRAIVSSVVFLAVMVAAQWPFASFLMSPASRNWVFGTLYFDYGLPPTSSYVRHVFRPLEATASGFWMEMAAALAFAALTIRIGLAGGDWMRRIRR